MARCIAIGIDNPTQIKPIKTFLEELGVFNRNRRIYKSGNLYQLYTTCHSIDELRGIPKHNFEISYYDVEPTDKCTLEGVASVYLRKHGADEEIESLLQHLPRKWSVYPPMVLFNSGTFDTDIWGTFLADHKVKDDFFEYVLSSGVFSTGLSHIAVNKPIIEQDIMRRPFDILPLHGDFGPEPSEKKFEFPSEYDFRQAFWCSAVQNGIYQTWAPRYTMFSRGNIKEKKRVLEKCKDSKGKCVFDLYAGIGYFTLSYLKTGGTVFCWEINPWSIKGLIKSVAENGYKFKLIKREEYLDSDMFHNCEQDGVKVYIFHESNEFAMDRYLQLGHNLPIVHINLGLLPTSSPSWPTAKSLAHNSSTRSILHIHENVHVYDFDKMSQKVADYFQGNVAGINKVKTFAPDIWHLVIDVSFD